MAKYGMPTFNFFNSKGLPEYIPLQFAPKKTTMEVCSVAVLNGDKCLSKLWIIHLSIDEFYQWQDFPHVHHHFL